jgi:nicotinic acid mononucleotide adenylyltransferase
MPERILIMGGSFDPPHKGHKALLLAAARTLKPGRVLLIPAFQAPLKGIPGAPAGEGRSRRSSRDPKGRPSPQEPSGDAVVELLSACWALKAGTVTLDHVRENCGREQDWTVKEKEGDDLSVSVPVTRKGAKLADISVKLPVKLPKWQATPVCALAGD